MVWLNPWELARLAQAKGLTPGDFRDRFCEFGGTRLRFDKKCSSDKWNGLTECSQYVPDMGCSLYEGRPLVCRLYPIARIRHGDKIRYAHMGTNFPCLANCPEVLSLPSRSVSDYLDSQNVSEFEKAQDLYLDIVQHIADNAFMFLFESGLAESGDKLTLRKWRNLGSSSPEQMAKFIGQEWLDLLLIPHISDCLDDMSVSSFAARHQEMLDTHAQEAFGNLCDFDSLRKASSLMAGLALHLARGLGANTTELAAHWITTAKNLGAKE